MKRAKSIFITPFVREARAQHTVTVNWVNCELQFYCSIMRSIVTFFFFVTVQSVTKKA